ncbi:MAG TPA: methyltransferase domain-containing protein [Candidatus Acidoferrum sp.]|nr:methyltransferase domain-containing protein [Candidatus Acidoferrum sp.]
MADWNPGLYLKFERERTQPVRDLVARLEVREPSRILDIGCGPGNSTAVLKERWPKASVTGLDNSRAMIEKARRARTDIEWLEADAASDLSHLGAFDVVLANASLQWLPNHAALLPRLFRSVGRGGALAVQIPQFDRMPIAQALSETTRQAEFASFFTGFDDALERLEDAAYYDVLSESSGAVDLWVTHYYHVMEGHEAIIEWMTSTALRPYLDRLPPNQQGPFLAAVLARLRQAYPAQHDGRVLFIFKRLFFIAYRAGERDSSRREAFDRAGGPVESSRAALDERNDR